MLKHSHHGGIQSKDTYKKHHEQCIAENLRSDEMSRARTAAQQILQVELDDQQNHA